MSKMVRCFLSSCAGLGGQVKWKSSKRRLWSGHSGVDSGDDGDREVAVYVVAVVIAV